MSHQRHPSIGSSMSSEDEFDLFRTSQEDDAEVSVASSSKRPPPSRAAASYTAKTPMMKTPSMDALTRKYEFLLKHDKSSTTSKSAAGTWPEAEEGASFSTPPRPSADPHRLTRVQSYGSRNSSRSTTPTRQLQQPQKHSHSPCLLYTSPSPRD